MAVQLPQGLYSHYTNVFDTTPLMQANLQRKQQLEAKKQAKEEALNQYFNELPNKLNTAGVRQQDLYDPKYGGITKEIEDWSTQWKLNADAIKRGGVAQQEHMARYNNILRKIDQSKQRAKFELELGKAKFEGKYDPDDDDLNVLQTVSKSIYDPTSYKQDGVSEYGFQDLSPAIPKFDAKKQVEFFKAATGNLSAGKVYDYGKKYTSPTSGQVIVPFQKTYNPQQVKAIADEAGKLAMTDESVLRHYNKILNDPKSDEWVELNKAYQSVYGDKAIVSTPVQAAQADAILRASVPLEVGEEQEINYAQRQQDKRINISLNTGKAAGSEDISDYDLLSRYDNKVKGVSLLGLGNVKFIELKDIGAQDLKLISADGAVSPYKFGEYRGFLVRDDGDWEGSGGKVVSRSNVARANLDRTTVSEANRLKKILPPKGQPKKKTYKGLDKNGNPIFE